MSHSSCLSHVLSRAVHVRAQPQDKAGIAGRETERTEAAAQLERKMAAMEAALAARRQPIGEAKPQAARGPGADLRFQVRCYRRHAGAQHGKTQHPGVLALSCGHINLNFLEPGALLWWHGGAAWQTHHRGVPVLAVWP